MNGNSAELQNYRRKELLLRLATKRKEELLKQLGCLQEEVSSAKKALASIDARRVRLLSSARNATSGGAERVFAIAELNARVSFSGECLANVSFDNMARKKLLGRMMATNELAKLKEKDIASCEERMQMLTREMRRMRKKSISIIEGIEQSEIEDITSSRSHVSHRDL